MAIAVAIRPKPTSPPTTPPAMAPALDGVFDTEDGAKEDEAGDVLVVDAVVEVEKEDDVLLVEVGPDAVDSGAFISACAAVILNWLSAVTIMGKNVCDSKRGQETKTCHLSKPKPEPQSAGEWAPRIFQEVVLCSWNCSSSSEGNLGLGK